MTPRHITVADLRIDLMVEFLGDEADASGVLSEELTSVAMALYPGHPGRIWCPDVQHVQVSWVGLEEEPESYAVGFSSDTLEDDGIYRGLGLLAEAEFGRRKKAIANILNSGRTLSDWVPPWSVHD